MQETLSSFVYPSLRSHYSRSLNFHFSQCWLRHTTRQMLFHTIFNNLHLAPKLALYLFQWGSIHFFQKLQGQSPKCCDSLNNPMFHKLLLVTEAELLFHVCVFARQRTHDDSIVLFLEEQHYSRGSSLNKEKSPQEKKKRESEYSLSEYLNFSKADLDSEKVDSPETQGLKSQKYFSFLFHDLVI